MTQVISLSSETQLLNLLEPGQRIYVAGSSNEPLGLVDALSKGALPDNLEFLHFPLPGLNSTDFTALSPSARVTTFFMSSILAKADSDRVAYLPMQMRAIFDFLGAGIDVYMLQVAKDRHGVLRLGPNADFHEAALAGAKLVVAQLNTSIIAPLGAPLIDPGQIDVIVPSELSNPLLPQATPDPAAEAIGQQVANLIEDGDCLQTGIGAIPAAILQRLQGKNDLGIHGGLIDDGGLGLIRSGNVNGSQKGIDRGLHVTGMALGSAQLMEALAEDERIVLRGANHTHEVSAIRQLDRFVSVNSAVEVDLYGQVNAEMAGGRQISGTGGSVDFMRAAKASKGGRSIVAMTATARGGSISRIVNKVEMVTALRTDADIVVTEYGVARLKNLPNAERAKALIAIAAPQFRDELIEGMV